MTKEIYVSGRSSQALPGDLLPEERALYEERRHFRRSSGLSLEAIAQGTEYSKASWHRVLNGQAFSPRHNLVKLCARRQLDSTRLLQLWDHADAARLNKVTAAPLSDADRLSAVGQPGEKSDTVSGGAASIFPGFLPARFKGRLPFRRRWVVLLGVPVLTGAVLLIALWPEPAPPDDVRSGELPAKEARTTVPEGFIGTWSGTSTMGGGLPNATFTITVREGRVGERVVKESVPITALDVNCGTEWKLIHATDKELKFDTRWPGSNPHPGICSNGSTNTRLVLGDGSLRFQSGAADAGSPTAELTRQPS